MDISGDLMSLPETYLVSVTALSEQNIYSGPGTDYEISGNLLVEQVTFAMRRTEDGSWLEVPERMDILLDFVEVVGDVMRLPTLPAANQNQISSCSVPSQLELYQPTAGAVP